MTNFFKPYLLTSLILVSLCLLLLSCRDRSVEQIEKYLTKKKFPIESGKDIVFIYSDSAIIRARLTTPVMDKYFDKETTVIMPEGLKVTFFNKQSKPSSFLSANYGTQHVEKKIIEVSDSVVVVTLKGDTLTTEHLVWDERKNKV